MSDTGAKTGNFFYKVGELTGKGRGNGLAFNYWTVP